MKTYNRKLKKWVEEEKPVGSLKEPEMCKGKKPHEWVLMIPKYVKSSNTPILSKDDIEEYYKIAEEEKLSQAEFSKRYAKLGVRQRFYTSQSYYLYVCSKCLKEKISFKRL